MADLSESDILHILELIDRSSFDYFQLTLGDLHLTVSKTGPPEALPAAAQPPAAAAAPPLVPPPPAAAPTGSPPPASAATAPAVGSAAPAPPSAPPAASDAAAAGLVPVPSPMVGTFYVAPEPTAPPFVAVGAAVDEDTTVGLVEAMKVFTGVVAGVRGVIAQRVVDNGQFVEYGQTLFLVQPAGPRAEG